MSEASVLVLSLGLLILPLQAQLSNKASAKPQAEYSEKSFYSQVVTRVFAQQEASTPDEVFRLSITFREGAGPEFQIVLRQRRTSTATVELLTANQNIGALVNLALSKAEKATPYAIAARIRVSRQKISVPSMQSIEWQKEFLASVRATVQDLSNAAQTFYDSGEVQVALDANVYAFEYEQGLTMLAGEVSEPSVMAPWVARFKQEVQAAKAQ